MKLGDIKDISLKECKIGWVVSIMDEWFNVAFYNKEWFK